MLPWRLSWAAPEKDLMKKSKVSHPVCVCVCVRVFCKIEWKGP